MKKWLQTVTAFAGAAALTFGGAVAAGAANSVDDASNVKTFNVTWSNNLKRYEPALEGTKIDMLLYCAVYEFEAGKRTGNVLGYEWPLLTLTVGKDEQIPLKVDPSKYEGVDKIGVDDCHYYRGGKWKDGQFAFSTGYSDGVKKLAMDQQANTDFKFKLTEGEWDGETYLGVIPEGKAPKVSIGLKLTKEGKTSTLELRNGKPLVNNYVFADGDSHRPSAELDAEGVEAPFTRAFTSNDLNLFSGYTGRYKKYELTASIDDPEEAKLFRIESVEGNDSDGWTVNLSSVVRKITPEAPTVADSDKCGVAGTV